VVVQVVVVGGGGGGESSGGSGGGCGSGIGVRGFDKLRCKKKQGCACTISSC
jgi:hypothetical protein